MEDGPQECPPGTGHRQSGAVQRPPTGRHARPERGFRRVVTETLSGLQSLASLITSAQCLVCGLTDVILCDECRSALRSEGAEPFRVEQRAPALAGLTDFPVFAGADYAQATALAMLAHKRQGNPRLARELAAVLNRVLWSAAAFQAVEGRFPEPVLLIPVPGTGASFRRRGFDPLGLLLGCSRRTGLPPGFTVSTLLAVRSGPERLLEMAFSLLTGAPVPRWSGFGSGQKGLGAAARRRRLHGSMRLALVPRGMGAGKTLAGMVCLLVDDVLTTGATLAEAARVLSGEGALVRGAVVVAATRSPGTSQEKYMNKG